jgi:serine/threonine-protein kinase RsbW
MFGRPDRHSSFSSLPTALGAQTWRYRLLYTTAEMGLFLNELIAGLEAADYPRRDVFAVRLALEEAIVNAIKHGNGGDSAKPVQLRYCMSDDCFLAEVQDEGPGFSYAAVAGRADNGRPARDGRGLELILRYMTWIEYNEAGNCVTLCKYRSPE